MPKYPAEPHLFAYKINGVIQTIVRAASVAEARTFMTEHLQVQIVRATPGQAYHAASEGVAMLNARPEYESIDDEIQSEMFGADPLTPDSHADEVTHTEPEA